MLKNKKINLNTIKKILLEKGFTIKKKKNNFFLKDLKSFYFTTLCSLFIILIFTLVPLSVGIKENIKVSKLTVNNNSNVNFQKVLDGKSIEKKSVIAEIIVGSHPFGARLNPSETSLYVTNVQSNDVSIVDVADFSSTLRVKVGKKPYSIAFSKDGLKAYVTNQYSDSVSVIDTTSNEVTNTLSVGGFPEGIEVHNNNIYVVNWMDEEMQIVNENNVAVERLLPLGSNPRNFVNFSSPRFKLQ